MKTNLNQNSRLLEAKNPVHIEHLDKSDLNQEAYLQNLVSIFWRLATLLSMVTRLMLVKVYRFTLVTPEEERE